MQFRADDDAESVFAANVIFCVSLTLVSTMSNTLAASMSPAATCDMGSFRRLLPVLRVSKEGLDVAVNVDLVPLIAPLLELYARSLVLFLLHQHRPELHHKLDGFDEVLHRGADTV